MKKIETVIYIADDGTEFDDVQECMEYETSKRMKACMSEIADYCNERGCIPSECLFCTKDGCLFLKGGIAPTNWKDFIK